jgi:hypothetical protein
MRHSTRPWMPWIAMPTNELKDQFRATFSYGAEVVAGKRHVIWRRVGSHEIYENP